MPWTETSPMNERVKFIAARLADEEPFSATCERFGVSRKTGYKWLDRYESGGVRALVDQSRAPHAHPHAIAPEITQALISVRKKHRHWGPRKLVEAVRRLSPEAHVPAASTVAGILKREGLVRRKKRRRTRSSPYTEPLREYRGPNAVWCADFKGDFLVGNQRCYPLTISDGYSRFLLRCTGLFTPRSEPAKRVFESAFREFGLPEVIRTDNGAPFSTLAPAGLSRLAVWWVRLGIMPERIMPGRPDQNGRHERMHSTLKTEVCSPPKKTFESQQRAFDRFRHEYNHERPHEALAMQSPAARYSPSARPYPRRVPQPEYPAHFEVQRAYANGTISFRRIHWYVTFPLAGELVGLEQLGECCWKVFFGPVLLGVLDVRNYKKSSRQGDYGTLMRPDGLVDVPTERGRYAS